MARKIFIAATDQNCGKTTASLSLIHLAQKKYPRVGFFKPLGPKPTEMKGISVDKDAALMARVFGLGRYLRHMSPVVIHPDSTRKVLRGEIDPKHLEELVMASFAVLDKKFDYLIIEGSGHPGVGSVVNLSNAKIARLLDAKVLLITGGGIGNVIDGVHLNKALFDKEGVEVRAIMPNKLIPEKRDSTLEFLRQALGQEPFQVLGGFNYQPVLANPTLERVAKILDLEIHSNRREAGRIINHLQIGAPSTQRVTELLRDSTLVIVTSSRDELLVTLANMYQIPEYRQKLVGLLIPGVHKISAITQQILDRSKVPYLRTNRHTTGQLYRTITEDVYKLMAEDKEKIDLVRKLSETRFDFDALDHIFND